MAVKIVEDSAVLTLDFWDKETIYNGQVFPVGTLACDALNIPTEVVSHMEKLCEKLNGFMKTFDSGKGDIRRIGNNDIKCSCQIAKYIRLHPINLDLVFPPIVTR